jgi:hypothetical protein
MWDGSPFNGPLSSFPSQVSWPNQPKYAFCSALASKPRPGMHNLTAAATCPSSGRNAARRQAQIRLRDLRSSASCGSRAHSEGWRSAAACSNPGARAKKLENPTADCWAWRGEVSSIPCRCHWYQFCVRFWSLTRRRLPLSALARVNEHFLTC